MDCIYRHNGQCLRDIGGKRMACGRCSYCNSVERLGDCPWSVPDDGFDVKTSSIEKRAKWADVAAKAWAIVDTGDIEIMREDADEVEALVMSYEVQFMINPIDGKPFPVTDGGPYDVILSKRSWENSSNVGGWLQGYLCDCFIPGTLITMADGTMKKIEDIAEGDMVLSGEGVPRRVTHTMSRPEHHKVYKIKMKGMAEPVTCTGNHPWWAIERIRCKRCESHGWHPFRCPDTHGGKTPPRWIDAKELAAGMYVQLRAPRWDAAPVIFDMADYCYDYEELEDGYIQPVVLIERSSKNGKRQSFTKPAGATIKRYVPFDEQVAYVFGLYMGDGNLHSGNEVNWSFGSHEEHLADCVIQMLGECFGINVKKRPLTNDAGKHNIWMVSAYSAPLYRLMRAMCGEYSAYKKLAPELFHADPHILQAIVDGWRDADAGCSVNRDIISQMQLIMLANENGTVIRIPKGKDLNFSPLVQSKHTRQMHRLYWRENPKQLVPNQVVAGDGQWVCIESVTEEPYDGMVYNLEVEEDHTYLAYGYKVHNCRWGQYHSGSPDDPGLWAGRLCSHAAAIVFALNIRARKDFMNDRTAGLLGPDEDLPMLHCIACGAIDGVDPSNGLCPECNTQRTFDNYVASVYCNDPVAERWLEVNGSPDMIDEITYTHAVEHIDDGVSTASWNGLTVLFTPTQGE